MSRQIWLTADTHFGHTNILKYMDVSREVIGITGMELPKAGSDSDKGMLVSDVFLNVPVVGGEDRSVACLAEQQDERDDNFALRMFDSYVRLRAQRPAGRTTGFAICTGDSGDVNSYSESCCGLKVSLEFRTFHLPSCNVEELREDKHAFARVMYAGRLSLESGDDAALREKYAWEILNTTSEQEYDARQRKFILEFADRIFWLKGPGISKDLKEAYKMQTITLEEYSKQISKEVARMEGIEEVANNFLRMGLPVEQVAQGTGLSVEEVSNLKQYQ